MNERARTDAAPVDGLTIREAAERTGITAHTLRYYERAGILGRVPRVKGGHRRYGEAELRLIVFLRKMQATGMSIRDLRAYAVLLRRGEGTEAQRLALLVAHEAKVREAMAELSANLVVIQKKIELYSSSRAKRKAG